VAQLRIDAPGSAVLAKVEQYAQARIEREVHGLAKQHSYKQAQSLLHKYSALGSPRFMERQRESLTDAQLVEEHKGADVARQRQERIATLKAKLAALLSRGPGNAPARWNAQLREQQGALSAYLAANNPYFARVRSQAAQAYLKAADRLRVADRITAAQQMLAHARLYRPAPAQLAREVKLLRAARAHIGAAAAAQAHRAQTEALEQSLLGHAEANNVNDALALLKTLKARLPADDPFLLKKAPAAIGNGYLRLARSAALDGRFDAAQHLAQKGHSTVPSFAPLADASKRYALYLRLDREVASIDAQNVARFRTQIERASHLAPKEARALDHTLARTFAARIASAPNAAAADQLTALGRTLFPNDRQLLKASTSPKVTHAAQTSRVVPSATPRAQGSAAPQAAAPLVAKVTTPKSVSAATASHATQPLSLHNCANPELIGEGSNPRASCWDEIAGGRGPLLVVVPAPPGGHAFAIGRYDVSNADFARYCHATGKCSANGGSPGLPVTSISIAQAEGYLHWLSRKSGAVYRLPTAAEYVYAADAGTSGGENPDANCRKPDVAVTLLPVNSGEPNAWGLYDVDGNVQQWVRSGSKLQARGGDYRDSFSDCKPTTARPQTGAPSGVTGFRVLREIK